MSRAKKPDNLFQRGKTWYIRYNANGEKIIKSLRTTSLREAKRKRDEILGHRSIAVQLGIEPPKPRKERVFSEVADLWGKAREADSEIRSNSVAIYERMMRLWILPYFGHMRMSAITVEEIEHFIAHLRKSRSPATGKIISDTYVSQIFSCLRAMYKQAIKRRWYVGINPIDQLERIPRPGPGREVTLTETEARALLDELSGRLYFKVGLALYTGLRWGEVHGLEWQGDIELETEPPTLTVQRSFRGPPKNEASAATIPLCEDAASLLRRWQREQGPARYVFPNSRGNIPSQKLPRDLERIKEAAERAGIAKNVTPHVFRHTFGTWVYERTSDPKIVQRLMRHGSFTTSMRYVHDRRELGSVVNRLPSLTGARLKAV